MKNRLVAALLALFLGYVGIHKFYLGENLAGILYLIFSWTLIPGLIAFFEFLGLVLMSDQSFDAKFNYQYITPSQPKFEESSRDKAATLVELKRLYDQGIITAEEFEEKRRKILDSI
ncbi:NINE protein [Crocosphaera sp. XPORK-15E]|uniref:NINE protein n=1 Tax=Crocosphaera sp. XPORK-15E TaxID=3110247 RepID=UPI002B20290B|nr:NINE protein [Crocosphaera sp. XPORK-15E]MEA5535907.1 NINE protein [Crocosphaera sp. XPORK-15E]